MNRKYIFAGLAAVIVFQISVLAAEYLGAVYPLWTGQEVRLKTVPVDPRSMFRGNYAQLRYDLSNIPRQDLGLEHDPRNGEVVYVLLKPGKDGLHEYAGASLTRPKQGLYLRGRVQMPRWREGGAQLHVRYGIEAFFAPKEKALKLERELRQGGVASIMVAGNGRATLKNVLPQKPGQ